MYISCISISSFIEKFLLFFVVGLFLFLWIKFRLECFYLQMKNKTAILYSLRCLWWEKWTRKWWPSLNLEVILSFKRKNVMKRNKIEEENNTRGELETPHILHLSPTYCIFVSLSHSLGLSTFTKVFKPLGIPLHLAFPFWKTLVCLSFSKVKKNLRCVSQRNLKERANREYEFWCWSLAELETV